MSKGKDSRELRLQIAKAAFKTIGGATRRTLKKPLPWVSGNAKEVRLLTQRSKLLITRLRHSASGLSRSADEVAADAAADAAAEAQTETRDAALRRKLKLPAIN